VVSAPLEITRYIQLLYFNSVGSRWSKVLSFNFLSSYFHSDANLCSFRVRLIRIIWVRVSWFVHDLHLDYRCAWLFRFNFFLQISNKTRWVFVCLIWDSVVRANDLRVRLQFCLAPMITTLHTLLFCFSTNENPCSWSINWFRCMFIKHLIFFCIALVTDL
jgi:hypothetical protein